MTATPRTEVTEGHCPHCGGPATITLTAYPGQPVETSIRARSEAQGDVAALREALDRIALYRTRRSYSRRGMLPSNYVWVCRVCEAECEGRRTAFDHNPDCVLAALRATEPER